MNTPFANLLQHHTINFNGVYEDHWPVELSIPILDIDLLIEMVFLHLSIATCTFDILFINI